MSQRKKVLILITTSVILFAILGLIFFSKGTLVISSNVPIGTLLVDGKNYPVTDSIAHLPLGPHNIVVNQTFYEPAQSSTFILPWTKENIAFYLTLNADGQQIINNAKIVTNYSATFTSDNDANKYLSEIKRYIDDNTYQNLSFEISDSIASQFTTTPTSLPKVFLPIKNTYLVKDGNGATATAETTKTNDELSLSSLQYSLSKINNSWTITNIIYNN